MKPFVFIALTTVIACQDQAPSGAVVETETGTQLSTSQLEQSPSTISETNQFLQYVDSLEIMPTECTFGGEISTELDENEDLLDGGLEAMDIDLNYVQHSAGDWPAQEQEALASVNLSDLIAPFETSIDAQDEIRIIVEAQDFGIEIDLSNLHEAPTGEWYICPPSDAPREARSNVGEKTLELESPKTEWDGTLDPTPQLILQINPEFDRSVHVANVEAPNTLN